MTTRMTTLKISTVKEFRDKATQMFKSEEPVMITRRGKIAGFFLPYDNENLPFDMKKQLQQFLAHALKESLDKQNITEEDILADFEASR